MKAKRFIPCIYLYQTKAVKSHEDRTVINANPLELAKYYAANHADELIIFDLSHGDQEHEEAIEIIKEICSSVFIPVIGCGNIQKMEDVKKLLYAGCKKAALNYEKLSNISLTEEVSLKFGKEKIAAVFSQLSVLVSNRELIEEYVSEGIYISQSFIWEMLSLNSIPMIINLQSASLDKILELMRQARISGVTGNTINENSKKLTTIKKLCEENGITIHAVESFMEWQEFKLNTEGLLPVVVQDYRSEEVLMVAYMNEEAFHQTLKTGQMTYYSRSRKELWLKGATSGHYQQVKALYADCDNDTLLAKVDQTGAACHTGRRSCFYKIVADKRETKENPLKVFETVYEVIKDRKIHPKEGSYTNYLFEKGTDKILKKLGEESTEIIIAAKNPNPSEIKYEIADYLYHMMVLMVDKEVSWDEITEELSRR